MCAPGGVLIEVEAISIEGGDTLQPRRRRDADGARTSSATSAPGRSSRSAPASPTATSAQRVVAIMMHGSHAERVAVPAVHHVGWCPTALDVEVAACVPIPFGTADDCLFEFGRLQAGETVLDPGRRGRRRDRGRSSSRSARARPCSRRRRATTSSSGCNEFGLDHGINYRDDATSSTRCASSPAGRGVRPGRRLRRRRTLAGQHRRASPIAAAASPSATRVATRSALDVSSARGGQPARSPASSSAPRPCSAPPRVHAMIDGHLRRRRDAARCAWSIDRRFPLAEAAAAHAYIESRRPSAACVMIP